MYIERSVEDGRMEKVLRVSRASSRMTKRTRLPIRRCTMAANHENFDFSPSQSLARVKNNWRRVVFTCHDLSDEGVEQNGMHFILDVTKLMQ